MRCVNHADRSATHVAEMPIAVRPYREDAPFCAECAGRIETIGFPVTPLAEMAPS